MEIKISVDILAQNTPAADFHEELSENDDVKSISTRIGFFGETCAWNRILYVEILLEGANISFKFKENKS